MQHVDRWVGVALALLGTAVLWTSRAFPAVPGQKVGAGFLPGLVGAGLLLCGVLLVLRGGRTQVEPVAGAELGRGAGHAEQYGPALVVIGACVFYILLADVLGFLIVAPLALLAVFRVLHVRCCGRSVARWSCTSRSTSCCVCPCPGASCARCTEGSAWTRS